MRAIRFLMAVLLLSAVATRADAVIVLLATDQKPATQEFIVAFKSTVRRVAPGMAVRDSGEAELGAEPRAKAIVAVGSAAFQTAIRKAGRTPVVAALVPRAGYERLLAQQAGNVSSSAVYLDQPEERQLSLISLLPGPPKAVGVMRSLNSALSLSRLRAGAQKYALTLIEETLGPGQDVGSAMQKLIGQVEVILATPDPEVFNQQTIQGILLGAYRSRIPLVGFSPAYTRAGALVSLHSSVSQLAEQTAEMVAAIGSGGTLPGAQWPRRFEVSSNRQVARSLGVELPTDAALAEGLRLRERAP